MSEYRIQKRKWSSNIIEILIAKTWSVYLCPTIKKKDGDALSEKLMKIL